MVLPLDYIAMRHSRRKQLASRRSRTTTNGRTQMRYRSRSMPQLPSQSYSRYSHPSSQTFSRNGPTAGRTALLHWKLREQSRVTHSSANSSFSRRNTSVKKFVYRSVPTESLHPSTKGFGYVGPPAPLDHHSKLVNPFKNWKPVTNVTSEIVWPMEYTPMFAISIRPERLAAFRQRMGPWAALIHHWAGTDGRRIDKGVALAKGLITPNAKLNRGQLGCYHSHVRLWKFIVQQNIPYAFITEDDADISYSQSVRDQLVRGMQQLQTSLPNWGLVYVGHNVTNRGANEENRITENISVPKLCAGLFSYVIKKEVCERLLQLCAPYYHAVDLFVADMINQGKLEPFKAFSFRPALCYVVPVRSDTESIA
jgi:hypothetical protein